MPISSPSSPQHPRVASMSSSSDSTASSDSDDLAYPADVNGSSASSATPKTAEKSRSSSPARRAARTAAAAVRNHVGGLVDNVRKPNKAGYTSLGEVVPEDNALNGNINRDFNINNNNINNSSNSPRASAAFRSAGNLEDDGEQGFAYGTPPGGAHELRDFQRVHSKIPPHLYMIMLASFAAICGFLGGYDTGIISGATLFIREDFHLSDAITEVIVSGVIAGAVLGGLASGPIADRFGRKPVIVVAAAVFIVGALLMGLAPNWPVLLVGRVIAGAAVGAGAIVPVYIGELAPKEVRGKLTNFNSFYIALGQLISYIIAFVLTRRVKNLPPGVSHDSDEAFVGNWRLMLGLAGVPAFLQLLGAGIMPESPRYLVQKGKRLEACRVLSLVRDRKMTSNDIVSEVMKIDESILHARRQNANAVSLRTIFTVKSYRKLLIIATGLQMLQQLSGINTIMYYSATILKMAGFRSKSTAILFSSFIGLANCIGSLISMQIIDRFGRRPLLLSTLVGVFATLCILCGTFRVLETHPADSTSGISGMSWATLVTLIAYILFYATGLGCVPWAVLSELFPLEIRGKGAGLAIAGNWFSNFVISITFLTLTHVISTAYTFLIYAGFVILGWFFVFFKVPETKGKSLEALGDDVAVGFAH